jgi:hypothetical protein
MPENYTNTIVDLVADIARKAAKSTSPVVAGTVLGVNADGSVNVDDGSGGCARVAAVSNQVVTCGSTVVLGLEPSVGNTTALCQLQTTITASSKGCPVETRTEDEDVVVVPPTGYLLVDNRANIYDYATGALLATGVPGFGGPTGTYNGTDYSYTEGDISYGYSNDPDPYPATTPTKSRAGVLDDSGLPLYLAPNYDDVIIGDYSLAPTNSGYQGSSYPGSHIPYLGRLVLGQGSSTDRLLGMEIVNDAAGDHGPNWTVVIRQLSDFSIIATNAATYLSDWATSFFYVDAVAAGPSVSSDADGSFWITIQNARTDGNPGPNPMFNVSATDGSLIRTVELATPLTAGEYRHCAPVPI